MKKKLILMNKQTKKKYIIGISIGFGAILLVTISLLIVFRHVHNFGEWEHVRDASCTQYGIERRFCDCGEMQENKYDKLPHTESDWIYDKDKDNLKKICTVCGKNLKFDSLDAHTHSFGEYSVKTEPTCTKNGLNVRMCQCGATDEQIIDSLGHIFGEWIITSEAKCGIEGTKTRLCNICQEAENISIPALSHTQGNWIIQDNQKMYPCTYCQEILKSEDIQDTLFLDIINNEIIGIGSCEDSEIVIPSTFNGNTISKIGDSAFKYQTITGVILNDSITIIEDNAFIKCLSLSNIYLGKNLEKIGEKAFFNCKSLTNIVLPDSLNELGEQAFGFCFNLESIHIGSNIKKLPTGVFSDCQSLKAIHFNGTKEQWNHINKDSDWDKNTGNYTVYCIDGNIEK